MKSVLIVDAQPMLLEYLREKLIEEKIQVETAESERDAFTKLLSILPDLIIIDLKSSVHALSDFFAKKVADVNAKRIPVIVTGPTIEKEEAAGLVEFGVIKYFARPIKFDLFFESVGRVLHTPFAIDTTPSVLDVHLNGDIIFIEIAMGMNSEKLLILKYKISEIIDTNKIKNPKIILMLTSLSLSFVDGYNLEILFQNITADKRVSKRNIKVLSLDSITKEFIQGHQELMEIEVATNLSNVLASLVGDANSSNVQDVITDKILVSTTEDADSVEIKFSSDGEENEDTIIKSLGISTIAIVDDEAGVRKFISDAFKTIGVESTLFANGNDFVAQYGKQQFDLIFLDIYMPGISGLDVLNFLKSKNNTTPIIVYSQLAQKEYIMKALSLGAKSYIIKPQPEQALVHKAMEVLNAGK